MRVASLVCAEKTDTFWGRWNAGRIPAAEFQMRAGQDTLRNPRAISWRVVQFMAAGQACRLLVQLNAAKETCRFTLGVRAPDGFLRIVCVHEFHPGEPGWHCHAVKTIAQGVRHWNHSAAELQRWPRRPRPEAVFDVDHTRATAMAVRFFRLETPRELL